MVALLSLFENCPSKNLSGTSDMAGLGVRALFCNAVQGTMKIVKSSICQNAESAM